MTLVYGSLARPATFLFKWFVVFALYTSIYVIYMGDKLTHNQTQPNLIHYLVLNCHEMVLNDVLGIVSGVSAYAAF